ncbi:mucin-5AC-like [Leptodactylus fuscus]
MGTWRGAGLVACSLIAVLTQFSVQGLSSDYSMQQISDTQVTFIGTPTPVMKTAVSAHNGQVCSTWGNSYFKTFDGDIFYFPGTCNYLYASNCKSNFEDFNIQIRRSIVNKLPTISHISVKIDGVYIELQSGTVAINGLPVELPYSFSGVQVGRTGMYIQIAARLGLQFMWNEDDAILLELDPKFANQTCGLCGDYNGIPIYNEFITNNVQVTTNQYGNMQKLNGPQETCQDVLQTALSNCTDTNRICEVVLRSAPFSQCNSLVDPAQYIDACVQDLCRCSPDAIGFCLCNTFTEYSRQCTHAGGVPQNWRTAQLCPLSCNYNMEYKECGSACPNTCTNPERSLVCDSHCIDGCFCPAGTVFDDINNSGCVPVQQCYCTYNGQVYTPGTGYSAQCRTCTCSAGKWSCVNKACPGSCSIEGGSHITSFDLTRYMFHGDCSYVLTKTCYNATFSVLGELRTCGLTTTETCLKSVTLLLNDGKDLIFVKPCGTVYVNSLYTQLPISSASVTIFKPSSFFIIVQTTFGLQLQIQLVPTMQLHINLDPSYQNTVCGLCGNFNNIQADDFRVLSGVIEGTGSSFANTWMTQADCPIISNSFENPCALSIENELYAKHWCSMLTDPAGPFAECHSIVNPDVYNQNCMFDSCNCAQSEQCMCAALSSYVYACAAKGIILKGWRQNVCTSYTTSCAASLTYSYSVSRCQPTCRSLSSHDITCDISFVPVDGCICQNGTYLDDSGRCVLAADCSCYYKGTAVPPGEVVHDNGAICTCSSGKLDCIGKTDITACASPMVYFDCTNKTAGTKGAECQKSCQTLDMQCYSAQCISGCVCPAGLISDGKGGCVAEEQCPCIHNNEVYAPGSNIRIQCNTCKCVNRNWECTSELCMGTCAVYGDGNYITFDTTRYVFSGSCEYTLAQDYCSGDPSNGTFRVITENIPCGSTGTTCSKSIKVFLGNYQLILSNEKFQVVKLDVGVYVPYKVRQMGIYMVIEALNGLVLVWDTKTTIFIKLEASFQGKVCGLCGNYDGNAVNDFTTRSLSVVGNVAEFGNSWKLSPSCPDAMTLKDPCSLNPYRKSWAQRQCSIITSAAFSPCHALVDPLKYYDACVSDSCACDTGGDCECFCTAVASYAQACSEAGTCINWRTPTMCPLFCDFYNQEGHCEWHYKACGAKCLKTCRNPSGSCYHNLPGLEGCYPNCPEEAPYFNEDTQTCVPYCDCYDEYDHTYPIGAVMPSYNNGTCTVCNCTEEGKKCYNLTDCCMYAGKMYKNNDTIYNTTDGIGGCITAICYNGEISRIIESCSTTSTPSTTFHFSTTSPTTTTVSTTTPTGTPSTTSTTTVTTVCARCTWSNWYDVSGTTDTGDFETFTNIRKAGYSVCASPRNVRCRAKAFPETSLAALGQNVTCSKDIGLICYNSDNRQICYNYEISIECCESLPECGPTTSESPTTTSPPSTTTGTSTVTPTVTPCTKMDCRYTRWFDLHAPTSNIDDGDRESLEEIKSRGYEVCTANEDVTGIQCEAVVLGLTNSNAPNQTYKCDLKNGLRCNNSDQPDSQICYNYRVQFECCSKFCEKTTPVTTPSTTTETPITETETPTSTVPTPFSETTPIVETTTPTNLTTTSTTCAYTMTCRYTNWFDLHAPTSDINDGDMETIANIKANGYSVCTDEETETNIECEATVYGSKDSAFNNQVYQCNLKNGLVCYNKDQNNIFKMCFNYRVRIECCSKFCKSETTPFTTTSIVTSTSPITTTPTVSSTPSTSSTITVTESTPTSTETTTPICTHMDCRYTQWFNLNRPLPGIDGSEIETLQDITSNNLPICTQAEMPTNIQCQATDNSTVNDQTYVCDLQNGLVCENKKQKNFQTCYNYEIRVECCSKVCSTTTSTTTVTETTTPTVSTTSVTPSTTVSTSSPTTVTVTETTAPICTHMDCRYTQWFNLNKPLPGIGGSEIETLQDITSKNLPICTQAEMPTNIQCQATDNSTVNDQTYVCDLQNGDRNYNTYSFNNFSNSINYSNNTNYSNCDRNYNTNMHTYGLSLYSVV